MTDPERLKGLLGVAMSKLGVEAPMQSAQLFSRWAEIVGADIAARCRPVSLKGGLLRIKTDSAVWAAEFQYLAKEVISRVNAELGNTLVKEIKVWIDPASSSDKTWKPGTRDRPSRTPTNPAEEPTQTSLRQAEEMASPIDDEALAEAVKKALLAAKMRRRRAP